MCASTASPHPSLLVVDDEVTVREALRAALADRFRIHEAACGAEACAVLAVHPVAAIILDAMLREEHGLDLVAPFRRLSPAPILVLTGHSSEDLAIRALRLQVAEYLKKPVSLPALHTVLCRLVPPADSPAALVARAGAYLDAHLATPFRSAALAGVLGISEAHLRRLFRSAHGRTPRRYLTDRRLQRAATLLRDTDDRVEAIAADVGYPSSTLFGRAFRAGFGMTPSGYRSQARTRRP